MSYKDTVQQIRDLPWSRYHPFSIVTLSLASAMEFAESLRCAIKVHPGNKDLLKMAQGELATDNLVFGGYRGTGDHWQFLDNFVSRFGVHTKAMATKQDTAVITYLANMKMMTDDERAMTVFSREHELPGIFEEILKAHDWRVYGLSFYEYYLRRHIELDSGDEGHGQLTEGFDLNERVLDKFYSARLAMYQEGLLRMD